MITGSYQRATSTAIESSASAVSGTSSTEELAGGHAGANDVLDDSVDVLAQGEDRLTVLRREVLELVLHDPRHPEVLGVPLGELPHDGPQCVGGGVCGLRGGDQHRAGGLVSLPAQLEEQVLLGREVDVDPGGGQPGAPSDVAGRGRVEALGREGVGGGFHEPGGGVRGGEVSAPGDRHG